MRRLNRRFRRAPVRAAALALTLLALPACAAHSHSHGRAGMRHSPVASLIPGHVERHERLRHHLGLPHHHGPWCHR
jgi:hypothetical protein